MEKKWNTLRKVNRLVDEEDDQRSEPFVTSRIPRRRKQAREESLRDEDAPAPAESSPTAESTPAPSGGTPQPAEPAPAAPPETAEPTPAAPPRPLDVEEPRILVVHDAAPTYRLIEETFGNFTEAKVDSTPDVLNAFELAILRDYQLFIVALKLPEMSGSFFYELVSRAYAKGLGNRKLAPAVVFVREANEPLPPDDVIQDVRVKAVWSKPLNIERMLDSVSTVIRRRGA